MEAEPLTATAPALGRPPLLRQQWRDVAFLHWAVDPAEVARLLPPGVRPDVLDGRTYVGLVPFRMVGTGAVRGPALPWLGTFLETNVRVYSVDGTGRRGVVFLSLDADRGLVVATARTLFGMRYRWARMRHHRSGEVHTYTARLLGRPGRSGPGSPVRSRVVVRAGAPMAEGPLERFLTARWGLHVAHLGRTRYLPNRHPRWPLRSAELLELDDGLVASVGLPGVTDRPPDHLAFSDGVPAVFGFPGPATRPRPGP